MWFSLWCFVFVSGEGGRGFSRKNSSRLSPINRVERFVSDDDKNNSKERKKERKKLPINSIFRVRGLRNALLAPPHRCKLNCVSPAIASESNFVPPVKQQNVVHIYTCNCSSKFRKLCLNLIINHRVNCTALQFRRRIRFDVNAHEFVSNR